MLTLLLLSLTAAPKLDPKLVGTWHLNGQPFVTLNADGSGVMEGDPLKWRAEKGVLTVTDADGEVDQLPYALQGEVLLVNLGGAPLQLTRKAGKSAPVVAPQAPVAVEAPARAGNDQLSRLLLSSNWCWLKYASGNTYTQKVHFSADGTWQDFSESDIYNQNVFTQSTVQGTGNRSDGGRWQVKNGQLWLSSQEAPQLQPVQLTVTRNSNGYPIINADGREYSMCN